MSKTLYAYYERELRFIRRSCKTSPSSTWPPRAGSCWSRTAAPDPARVERLIESFALLAGRVHHEARSMSSLNSRTPC